MTPESMGHDLTRNDPADQPRCPMEAAVDRANRIKCPSWLGGFAHRYSDGSGRFELEANINRVEQLDDLIAFLQEVKG